MYIVINCLGLPFNGDTIKRKSLGGSESAAYYMAREMAKDGHHVTLFTNELVGGQYDGVKYIYAGPQTEQEPLGSNFHFYAQNTPHDVLIIQRHPAAFQFNYASKVNLWWLHDLALLRNKRQIHQMLWNIDGIITVSSFHKDQVCDTWEVSKDIVHPIINAVDESLFNIEVEKKEKSLIYISRPERGLEHLVKEGGIMERLPNHKLYVCGYENTLPQTKEYYEHLWSRCDEFQNVENVGHLNKADLAKLMKSCEALIYPTPGPYSPNFEEVSCIAVMEAMHAGIGIITTSVGSLPETCGPYHNVVHCDLIDGMPNEDQFVWAVENRAWDIQETESIPYTWDNAYSQLKRLIAQCFITSNHADARRHLLDTSDIVAFQKLGKTDNSLIQVSCEEEFRECYKFYLEDNYKDHYEGYYEYEKARGVEYGPEDLSNNLRYQHTCNIIADLDDCHVVGDYGCAHGHYTINLAKRFPEKRFFGYDISHSNIEKARAWADRDNVENVTFDVLSALDDELNLPHHDAMLVCEILEHVEDPKEIINALSPYVRLFIASTPYGPWEAIGYKEHWPWRAHLHHFDRADITNLYGHLKSFNLSTVPGGADKFGRQLGSFVYTFETDKPLGDIDYSRKYSELVPAQTLSLAMIVKDAGDTIEQCLESCKEIIHEGVFGIDNTTTDETRERIHKFCKKNHIPWKIFDIESPLKTGFDAARNTVIDEASGSWIMWLDSDETLVNSQNIPKYLRNNQYNAYGVPQHHLTIEPPGLLKTDLPAKIFRNHLGIKFFGVVHEHPERALNEQIGHAHMLDDCAIGHIGYPCEDVRRGRFSRNIKLLERDRQVYPERHLGKMLYLRDLAQMCNYDAEQGNGVPRSEIDRRVNEGIKLWLELFDSGQIRLVLDGIPYYSMLSQIKGDCVSFSFNVDLSDNGSAKINSEHEINAYFCSIDHFKMVMDFIIKEKSKDFGSKYG